MAQLHVSAIDDGNLQVVHEHLSSSHTNNMWVVFRGRERVVQVRDFVFVKEGCVVWVTLGNHAIIKPCPTLFTAKPNAGFIIHYTNM